MILLIYSFLLVSSVVGRLPPRDPAGASKSNLLGETLNPNGYKYDELYIDVPLDHFTFTSAKKFPLRYFLNKENYRSGGPILFYTGNEGKLEGFAENTGFMWDIAPELGAAVVFVEHRFYGKSKPFGNDSYKTIDKLGYLSAEQALADFAYVGQFLKREKLPGAHDSALIAFGGSYGGMLAAWFRIKYPHIVDGSIAASAPIFWFPDSKIDAGAFDFIVTRAFTDAGCNRAAVEQGWQALENLAQTSSGRATLNKVFKLEPKSEVKTPEDVLFLKTFIKGGMEAMAMVNYPYPTRFLSPLPGWPVKKSCKFFASAPQSDADSLESMYQMANIYYNSSGATKSFCANDKVCGDAYAALGDPLGWPFQTCTEMTMPLAAKGSPNDFFWNEGKFTVDGYRENCVNIFKSTSYTADILSPFHGGLEYGATTVPTASNIVFSNGYLDPWSAGGYLTEDKVVGTVTSIIIKQGAHHYDLRGAHPLDTAEIKQVRRLELAHIKRWIKAKKQGIEE